MAEYKHFEWHPVPSSVEELSLRAAAALLNRQADLYEEQAAEIAKHDWGVGEVDMIVVDHIRAAAEWLLAGKGKKVE